MSKKERNQILGHGAESDGIEEYDNPMPNWWVGLFYVTIIWAAGYVAYYHFIAKKSYVEGAGGADGRGGGAVAAVRPSWQRSSRRRRRSRRARRCTRRIAWPAMAPALQGGIGPNLTDSTWIHGGTPEAIVATITNGVAAKGMPLVGPDSRQREDRRGCGVHHLEGPGGAIARYPS